MRVGGHRAAPGLVGRRADTTGSPDLAVLSAMLFALVTFFLFSPASGAELKLVAKSAVLMDAHTGRTRWAKSADLPRPPASTVKILTALVVLDHHRLQDTVTVPAAALRAPGAKAQLDTGANRTVNDLLYAMLLGSANDAAVALALHGGRPLQTFVERMNRKARALGAVHSRFHNPTGMPHPEQRTTAHDLALIGKSALQNPQLRTIVSARTYPWKSAQGSKLLENSNKLLGSYDGAVGVKTGNTREAGYCLVAAAERGHKAYIAVILNSREKTVWEDARKLLDHGFSESNLF